MASCYQYRLRLTAYSSPPGLAIYPLFTIQVSHVSCLGMVGSRRMSNFSAWSQVGSKAESAWDILRIKWRQRADPKYSVLSRAESQRPFLAMPCHALPCLALTVSPWMQNDVSQQIGRQTPEVIVRFSFR